MIEILQFTLAATGAVIVAVVWYFAVYLPGRTLEDWRDKRPKK